jgi:hypothetical protein
MTMQRSKRTSSPTIPKAAVNTRSRYTFAKLEKGPTHGTFWEAALRFGQTALTKNVGVRALR